MTNYFTFIVQSSLIDENNLVKFGQSDQMSVNLQISEFIATPSVSATDNILVSTAGTLLYKNLSTSMKNRI